VRPLEPRRGLEPFEDLPGLDEQRLGLDRAALGVEPLGVLEPCDGQVEGHRQLVEEPAGSFEQAIGLVRLAAPRGELGSEAGDVGVVELRTLPGRQALDEREQLLRLVEPVQRERSLHSDDERLLDDLLPRRQGFPVVERRLRGR
jgi:hypothetical protein